MYEIHKMKYIVIIILSTFAFGSCSHKQSKVEVDSSALLRDSIVDLIIKFQQDGDSMALYNALSLNEIILSQDTITKNRYYNYNTQIQILGLLGRKKEAFLLKDKVLSKNQTNIDRLIYDGMKHKLFGSKDSAYHYFSLALKECDKQDKDPQNIDLIIKKIEIYMYQNKKDEAKKTLDNALRNDPHNPTLLNWRAEFDNIYNKFSDYFSDIK